ncbi:MAG: BTAD domain-containing putative transcriptional regulator [Meiothermus sp.]|nr:BTAD domain-containing putative transcriptional regulator [Meiothermus sp.]
MSHLSVKLLGYPEVSFAGERLKLPTQKVQAVLYFLALRRRASREELAELLWEPEARHRLRPELHRLKNLPGAEDWLELDQTAAVRAATDLARFEAAVRGEQFAEALELHPENALLLQGFSVEDAPQFADWLEEERGRVGGLYREALRGRALQLSQGGQTHEALDLVRRLIELDPLDESAHRLAMRLEYARGYVQAALKHYDACRRALAEELGLEPQEETLALAREIQRGSALPAYQIAGQKRLPKAFLRPPLLVAREEVWARMEAAYEAGQAIFISGGAGTGKTRLMLDFARSKGDFLMAEGRIGDQNIPFSSVARLFRRYLADYPERRLEPWVRQELARLLPEAGEHAPGLQDLPRFAPAVQAFFAHAAEHFSVLPTDNLHLFDPLSAEISGRAAYAIFSQPQGPRKVCAINTFRSDEVGPEFWRSIEHFITQGLGVHIELGPLGREDLERMLVSLGLEDAGNLAARLHRLTGGNPQFVMETLKSLHATGQLDNIPERIALPERLLYVLGKRLDGLSTVGLRVAKAVATVEQTLSAETLAELLELNAFDVAEAIAELEQAQVFHNGGFVHDLLQEAAKAQTPAAVRRLLHKRMAALLERSTPDPALIAHHYLAADEREKALPWRLRAIEEATAAGFRAQAAGWLEELLFEATQDSKVYPQALVLKGQLLLVQDVDGAEACFREALELSKHLYLDLQVAALEGLAQCARRRHQHAQALGWLEAAFKLPMENVQRARLHHLSAIAHSFTGRMTEAEAAFYQAIQADPLRVQYPLDLATFRWHQGRLRENVGLLLDLLRRYPEQAQLTQIYHNLGTSFWVLGDAPQALAWLERSLEVWGGSGHLQHEGMTHLGLGSVHTSMGHYARALEFHRRAEAVFGQLGVAARVADAQCRMAYVYLLGGRLREALELCQRSIPVLKQHEPFLLSYALSFLSRTLYKMGDTKTARAVIEEAVNAAEHSQHPLGLQIVLPVFAELVLQGGDKAQAAKVNGRILHLARTTESLESLANALIFQAKLSEEASRLPMLTEALEIAERNRLAPVALEAAAALSKLDGAYEVKRLEWQGYLEQNALSEPEASR